MRRTQKMSFIVVTIIMILLATVFLNIPLTIGFASSKGVTKASVFVPMTEPIIAGLYAIIVYKFFSYFNEILLK